MSPTITQHLENPDVGLETYVRRKRLLLAEEIRDRTKVYLDTKYWILLRDVRLGRSDCSSTRRLLRALESRVSDGDLICPLNADVFFEITKQDDVDTLMATAQLIDDLSAGVCMLPMEQRINTEVFHFIESCRQPADAIHDLADLVWEKPAYVLGFVTPDCYTLPDDLNIAMQKSFADHMWKLGLVDMLRESGPANVAAMPSPFEDISDELNEGKFTNLDEHASFKEVFLSEVQGVLDVHRNALADLLRYIVAHESGQQPPDEKEQDANSGQMFLNLIYHAFRLNRIRNHIPSIRIGAGLHAAIRWDRNRKYKPNDVFDVHHAVAALPYCDLFFTERSLCHLIHDGNLEFGRCFGCKTAYKPSEVLALVEGIGVR